MGRTPRPYGVFIAAATRSGVIGKRVIRTPVDAIHLVQRRWYIFWTALATRCA